MTDTHREELTALAETMDKINKLLDQVMTPDAVVNYPAPVLQEAMAFNSSGLRLAVAVVKELA
jgi:hypothetical protein